jgi:hypothetical protein
MIDGGLHDREIIESVHFFTSINVAVLRHYHVLSNV